MIFHCYLCSGLCETHYLFCRSCVARISLQLRSRLAPAEMMGNFKIHSVGTYAGGFAELTKKLKSSAYGSLEEDARRFIRELVEHYCVSLETPFDMVMAIPGHPLRVWKETDLSLLIATELSRASKKPLVKWVQQKKTWKNLRAPTQKERSSSERKQVNVHDKFYLSRNFAAPLSVKILLVDDVCATASTLCGVRDLLLKRGYSVPAALVFARSEGLI